MVDITYADYLAGDQFELDFEDFISLTKGASIKSMAMADGFIELGLSDKFNVRFQGQFSVVLMSTLNKGELAPVRLRIVDDEEMPTALVVEQRIRSLRQLYAANFLINAERADEMAQALKNDDKTDLEELLKDEDRLFISAAGEGSFWLTVIPKTVAAFNSLSNILIVFYGEGRTALLERARAKTALAKLDVEKKRTDLAFSQANKSIDLAQKVAKIKNPWVRQQAEKAITTSLTGLGKEPLALPPPGGTAKGKE
jgi:UDP-N-acetylglucosamine transferase subunit ALG13